MKLGRILEILSAAALPELSRDELLHLARSADGPRFQQALLDVEAGHVNQVRVLDEIIAQHGWSTSIPRAPKPVAGAAGQLTPVRAAAAAPPYYNFHVYGQEAALCISEAQARSGGAHTIQIEGAAALGPQRYDWPNKIIVQLSVQELHQALALFERKIETLEFKGHGLQHDKILRLSHHQSHFMVQLSRRGQRGIAVKVSPADAFGLVSLAYRQIQRNAPHLDMATIKEMVNQVGAMHG